MALFISACGGGSDSSSSSAPESTGSSSESGAVDGEGMSVAWLDFGFGNTYSGSALKAAREEATKLNVKVEAFDGAFDPATQISQCQDAVTSGRFKAIAVGAIAPDSLAPCAKQAEAAGIPMVAWGNSISSGEGESEVSKTPGVVSQVFTPVINLYTATAEALVPACKGIDPCGVVDLSDLKEQPEIAKTYTDAIEKVAEENPNIELVAKPEAGIEVASGQTATQDLLSKGTEFNVLTAPAFDSLSGGLLALKSAGKKVGNSGDDIRIVATGATKEIMEGIRNDEFFATSVVLPATEGEQAIKLGTEAALGTEVPGGVSPTELEGLPLMISVENVGEYPDFKGQWSH